MKELSVRTEGRTANGMLQLLAVDVLLEGQEDWTVYGYNVPEFGLEGSKPPRGHRGWPKMNLFRYDVAWLRARIADGTFSRLRLARVVVDYNLLPDRAKANARFDLDSKPFHPTTKEDLVIHIRLGDIMTPGTHVGYGPLPIAWYKDIIEKTGLRPVFVGELGSDPYSDAIRRAFPDAVVLEGGSVLHDFNTLRNAHNVALGVSTFSWLAAWMGAKGRIFYPLLGLLNPQQYSDVNLTPLGDTRYEFHHFPIRKWRADADDIEAVISGPSQAKLVSQAEIKALVDEATQRWLPSDAAWKARMEEAIADSD